MRIKKNILYVIFFAIIESFVFSQSYNFTEMPATRDGQARRDALRNKFYQRQAKDRANYSSAALRAVEDLYQVANTKSHSKEAKENLEMIVNNKEYSGMNRFGCALLYLGTMNGMYEEDAIRFLKIAIENHSDDWYGDGVSVGAYARFVLGRIYKKNGLIVEAQKLFNEIKRDYPEAIDHSGNLLVGREGR